MMLQSRLSSIEKVKSLLERLSEYAGLTATRICARLDDQYGVEPALTYKLFDME